MTSKKRENPAFPEFVIGVEPPADRAEKALWFIFRDREILLKLNNNP